MDLHPDQFYHIYNRSNNNEIVFKSHENYSYFLKKYQQYFEHDLDTLAYCLMPTHFHFLVKVTTENIEQLKKKFGVFLSSYTKAINKQLCRHGSLFQQHTRTRHVDNETHLLTVATYIHQNPMRAGLTNHLEDWEFSSYLEYIDERKVTLTNKALFMKYFESVNDFKKFSDIMLQSINTKYWI